MLTSGHRDSNNYLPVGEPWGEGELGGLRFSTWLGRCRVGVCDWSRKDQKSSNTARRQFLLGAANATVIGSKDNPKDTIMLGMCCGKLRAYFFAKMYSFQLGFAMI
jgi:hypothetical protein